MAAEFEAMMQQSMARGVANAELRVWTPQGAQILFVRQVSPTVEDLTHRRTSVNDLTGAYPTGAWADESRDYHVAVRLAAKAVGQEQLAARVQLAIGDEVKAQGLVKAKWSDDSELTTRIDQQVAHYTGQTELAQAIQEGLAAKAAGNEELATTKLGRAVQLAKETGNEEATSKLRKVVDVEDEETGTVRLKKTVEKADEMALDTASTKTTRVRQVTTCPNGHETTATDYCDTCGVAMPADAATAEAPTPQPGDTIPVPVLDPDAPAEAPRHAAGDGQACPNCGVANAKDALFCEACGYDFTTGTMPRTEAPTADRRRPADGPPTPSPRAASPRRSRATPGWPSCGSTRSGTPSSPAPTRSRPPARPTSYP